VKVFFDSDVLIDVLTGRDPHYEASASLLDLVAEGKIKAVTSEQASEAMAMILREISIIPTKKNALQSAFQSDFKDKEDAIQYFSAIDSRIDFLVTRNIADYAYGTEIKIMTPSDFLDRNKVKTRR